MSQPQLLATTAKDRTIALRYSQELDAASVPALSELSVISSNPIGPLTVTSTNIFNDTLYIGVAELMLAALINITYNGESIRNKAGEEAATFINQGAVNTSTGVDNTVPTLLANGIVADEEFVYLYFSEVLSINSVPDPSAFVISQPDLAQGFLADVVEVYGIRATLTLDGWIRNGANLFTSYAPPASNPLKDPAGNLAGAIAASAAIVRTSRLAIPSMLSVYAAGLLLAQLPAGAVAAYVASNEKRQMLKFGSRDVNNGKYQGKRYDPLQVHEFPRCSDTAPGQPYAMPRYQSMAGEIWDYDLSSNRAIIPLDVKLAVILQSNSIAAGRPARLEAQHDGLASQGVGSLNESYVGTAAGSAAPKLCNEAAEMMKRFKRRSGKFI